MVGRSSGGECGGGLAEVSAAEAGPRAHVHTEVKD